MQERGKQLKKIKKLLEVPTSGYVFISCPHLALPLMFSLAIARHQTPVFSF